jgi:hypothetical protein
MPRQIVMDHTGDTRHEFDSANQAEVADAMKRFAALTALGFTAAVRTAPGKSEVARSFDPAAEETIFFGQSVGARHHEACYSVHGLA